MCLPGTCFSLFQGNGENKAAPTSTRLPRASPESRHQALNAPRCSRSLSSSPADSDTARGGRQALIGGH